MIKNFDFFKEIAFLDESNAIEGVYDYDSLVQARRAWAFLCDQKEMNVSVILKAHKILMKNHDLEPNEKGKFRKCQVWVGGREGIDWKYIPEAVEVWSMNCWLFPKQWKEHHVRFEQIHPFVDGNGRVGRMLMNWERLKAGLPVLVIREDKKQEYYKWFR
jgi:Fic family protein